LTQVAEDENGEKTPKIDKKNEFEKQTQTKSFSSEEVASLLKNGAYDIFRDDDDASNAFCEENIEQILSRRTKTIVHEETGASNFSKASFASESAQPELDVNDPDFWRKLMPEMASKHDSSQLYEPRNRKHMFDGDDLELDVSGSEGPEDDEHEGQAKKRRSLWTFVTRNKFQKSLMLFGYGRWSKIRQSAKIKLDEAEVIKYAEAYMRKLCAALNMNLEDVIKDISIANVERVDYGSDKGLREGAEKQEPNPTTTSTQPTSTSISTATTTSTNTPVLATTEHDEDPTLTEPSFAAKLQRTAKNLHQRLLSMASLSDLVRNGLKTFGQEWPEITGENPEWWGINEDRDLLIGVHNHGFGKYEPVRTDRTLCFFGRVKAVEKEKKKK